MPYSQELKECFQALVKREKGIAVPELKKGANNYEKDLWRSCSILSQYDNIDRAEKMFFDALSSFPMSYIQELWSDGEDVASILFQYGKFKEEELTYHAPFNDVVLDEDVINIFFFFLQEELGSWEV